MNAADDLIRADDARWTIPRGLTSSNTGIGSGGKTRIHGVRAVATVAMLLAAAAACTSDERPSTDPKTPATTPTKPQSASSTAASDAEDLIRAYYSVRDDLRQDPAKPLSQLKSVAIGVELTTQTRLFERERQQGRHQVGDTRLANLDVESMSLDNADPKAGRVPTVRVDVCYDVTDVDIVDRGGRSVVPASRPETGWIRYSVANYEYGSDPSGSWRVASSHDLERAPCEAG